jgi:hypothetical protein
MIVVFLANLAMNFVAIAKGNSGSSATGKGVSLDTVGQAAYT